MIMLKCKMMGLTSSGAIRLEKRVESGEYEAFYMRKDGMAIS
jgi:hypothetical protein